MKMERVHVYASSREIKKAARLATRAANTPVIAFSSQHAFRGGLSADAWETAYAYIHKIALAHGLPKIAGFYGLDTKSGEFLKYKKTNK